MTLTLFVLGLCLGATVLADVATGPNPVKTAAPGGVFVGYRNSSNTQSPRDLGFSGKVGNTWLLTFGDSAGVRNLSQFDPNTGKGLCLFLTGRAGGAVQGSNLLTYTDINATTYPKVCGDVPQTGYWCPLVEGEEDYTGLGITNPIGINATTGVIWTRPTYNSTTGLSPGAGLASVTFDSFGVPRCHRPFGRTTWGADEPNWGQLGAVTSPTDGYTYVYANGYNSQGNLTNDVVLSRVPTAQAFSLSSYEYYQGNGVFNRSRIYIRNLSSKAPQNLGFQSGQGTIFYSNFYNQYLYIRNGNPGNTSEFYALAAVNPWGPWSATPALVYTDHYPYPALGENQTFQAIYGAAVMPKYFSADGSNIFLAYTRLAFYEGVANITFIK